MATKKGSAKPQTKPEERGEVVERVCVLYESQHATLESCCQAAGIASRTFYEWLAENAEFAQRYKKAKTAQREFYWQEIIRPLAETGLEKLLKGQKLKTKTVEDLSFQGNLTGERAATEKEVESSPNPTAVIFTLKGLEPEMFADRSKVDQTTQVSHTLNLSGLTTEEKRQLAALWEKAKSE
ncbi:MAG: hypothetical protein E6Q97_13190 [Desulfurellales bacterium]|nr:MAG: hypothetical protein E6Q97_13190 [Desulfurellales bacterium]